MATLKRVSDGPDYNINNGRALGESIPISIATAIPLAEHIIKEQPETKSLYLNSFTLFRNYHGSFEKDSRPNDMNILTGFVEEVNIIRGLLEQANVDFVIYAPSYGRLDKMFPSAKIREPGSRESLIYHGLELKSSIALHKEGILDVLTRVKIPGNMERSTMIMTHYPIDLMSDYSFRELILLESRTGKIKMQGDWNTKLTLKPEHRNLIPFNVMTLQLFGDKGKHFLSGGIKAKRLVIKIAEEKRWNKYTSKAKILSDVNSFDTKDTESIELINQLFKVIIV